MRSRRLLPAVLTLPLVTLAACGGGGTSASGSDTPVAVATTSVLGSVLGQITECAGTASSSLMGPGDDPHTFQPSSAQMAELAGAELVVANGLDLEGGLESALANAEQDGATVLEVAPEVDPLPWGAAADDHDGHDHADDAGTDEHGDEDPHFWMDVSRMAAAAHVIGDALAEQTGDDAYGDCGAQIEQELTDTDAEVRELLAGIPEEKRVLITDHEAFGYFADAYDFEIAGVVVPGGSTDAEPSSAELAELTAVIDETGVPVIFSNTAVSTSLVDAVAAEAGTAVEVVELHVGSVGPEDSEAGTYQGMMVENARAVAEALG